MLKKLQQLGHHKIGGFKSFYTTESLVTGHEERARLVEVVVEVVLW